MIVRSWRIVGTGKVAQAFTGGGARRFGGRWNSIGTAVVYTASSISLAALEMLVHLETDAVLARYSVVPVEFEDSLVSEIKTLPPNWRDDPAPDSTRKIGDAWATRAESVVLSVPSAIVPQERNYILNPLHPEFSAKVKIGTPARFGFDHRLLKEAGTGKAKKVTAP